MMSKAGWHETHFWPSLWLLQCWLPADFDELSGTFFGNSDEEAASNVISSEYSAITPEPLKKPSAPHQSDPRYCRDTLEPDKDTCYSNTAPCQHTAHSSSQYASDVDARHQYTYPERIQQTILYCTSPSTVYVEPNRSEYWEASYRSWLPWGSWKANHIYTVLRDLRPGQSVDALAQCINFN